MGAFFKSRVLVSAEQGRVEHEIRVVAVLDQRGKHLVPNGGLGPSGEALLQRLPLAVALRKVAPVRGVAQHPTAGLYQQQGVSGGASGIRRLPRQHRRGSFAPPSGSTRNASAEAASHSETSNLDRNEPALMGAVKPECRLVLGVLAPAHRVAKRQGRRRMFKREPKKKRAAPKGGPIRCRQSLMA